MKRPAVIAAAVLAALAVAAAAGALLLPRGAGLPVSREMASFRMAGAGAVIQIDLHRLWSSPWAAASLAEVERRHELIEPAQKWLAEFLQQKGPGRSEITFIEITGGTRERARGAVLAIETAQPAGREAWEAFLAGFAVFSRPKLQRLETHSGVDIYAEGSGGIAFPTDRLTVLGSLPDLRAGIDNLQANRAARLDPDAAKLAASAPPNSCVVIAIGKVVTDAEAQEKMEAKSPSDDSKIESALIWLSADQELDYFHRLIAGDRQQGKRMREEGRSQLLELAGKVAPKADLGFLRDILAGATVGGRGRECEVRVKLPTTLAADLIHCFRMIFGPRTPQPAPPPGTP